METPDAAVLELGAIRGRVDLDQYFGLWAVEDSRFLQLLQQIRGVDLLAHIERHAGEQQIAAAAVTRQEVSGQPGQAIAVIDIQGTMTKRGTSFSDAGSMIRLRQAVRAAARDPEIGGVMLRIDSPGGTVAGTSDLAREVRAAAEQKPVFAYVEDLAASGAYWVASQAEKIFANDPTALIGSIGTYVGLYDFSGAAARDGIKAVVIRSGKFKGAGFPGTEITDEQKAHWQQIIDATQEEFSNGVSAGRKLPRAAVDELADGRVHVAPEAKRLGLIDGVQSFDQTVAELQNRIRRNSIPSANPRRAAVSETIETKVTPLALPQPASFADLKAGLPGADAAFLCSQLEQSAPLAQATAAWMAEQNRRLEESRQEAAEAKAAAALVKPGVHPVGGVATAGEASVDPIAAWNEAIAAELKAGAKSKADAARAVVRKNPELHQALHESAKV